MHTAKRAQHRRKCGTDHFRTTMSVVTLFRCTSGGWVQVTAKDNTFLDGSEVDAILNTIAAVLTENSSRWTPSNLAQMATDAQQSSMCDRPDSEHMYDRSIIYIRGLVTEMQNALPQFRIVVSPLAMTCDYLSTGQQTDFQARIRFKQSNECFVLLQRKTD
jgi:hypothetical protein